MVGRIRGRKCSREKKEVNDLNKEFAHKLQKAYHKIFKKDVS